MSWKILCSCCPTALCLKSNHSKSFSQHGILTKEALPTEIKLFKI
jgi:hypothetical protein